MRQNFGMNKPLLLPNKLTQAVIKHDRRRINTARALAMLACLSFATPILKGQTYVVTDMGDLPDKREAVASAINEHGEAAGTASTGGENETAFRYRGPKSGGMEAVVSVPMDSITRGFGINDAGQIVGDSSFGTDPASEAARARRAAIFTDKGVADLGTLDEKSPFSRANDINASGQVVGFSGQVFDSNASRAFIWTADTGMLDIGTLGGDYAQASAINDNGYVTGSATTSEEAVAETHAFLLHRPITNTEAPSYPMQDLGTLGGSFSHGTSINANNHVVGYSTLADGRFHAFLHDGKTMHDIGALGKEDKADQSFALGVNNADHVVGYTFLPLQRGAQQVAFLYHGGVMVDLNELIGSAAKDYLLYSANAINDRGQIVATAYAYNSRSFRAVLLTPVKLSSEL